MTPSLAPRRVHALVIVARALEKVVNSTPATRRRGERRVAIRVFHPLARDAYRVAQCGRTTTNIRWPLFTRGAAIAPSTAIARVSWPLNAL